MYFDFDDRYTDIEPVGQAISRREAVVMSAVAHAAVVALLMFLPPLIDLRADVHEEDVVERLPLEPANEEETPRFVFVQPRIDTPAPAPPERAELSDVDRRAQTPELPIEPANPLPFARGNSAERIEAAPELLARGRGPDPEPSEADVDAAAEVVERLPDLPDRAALSMPREAEPARPPGGSLGDALRNLQEYVQRESFNNPQGGTTEFGPHIQFDTKGVEFGPWIRRFIAQVRRNWFVPNAAMLMRGRVVVQFNVHKDGRITDLEVVGPSNVDSFNTSSLNALLSSNPTAPLPPEYPADKAFFTVTFFYNESPGPRQ
jgi:TonB family protein